MGTNFQQSVKDALKASIVAIHNILLIDVAIKQFKYSLRAVD